MFFFLCVDSQMFLKLVGSCQSFIRSTVRCSSNYRRFGRKPPQAVFESEENALNRPKPIKEVLYTNADLHSDYASRHFLENQQKRLQRSDEEDDEAEVSIRGHQDDDDNVEGRNREEKVSRKINRNEDEPDDYPAPFAPIRERLEKFEYSDVQESKRKSKSTKRSKRSEAIDDEEREVLTTANGLSYKVLDKRGYEFIDVMVKMRLQDKRDKIRKILLEGHRLIEDALLAGLKLDTLFFVDADVVDTLPLIPYEGRLFKISESRMKVWSDLEAPPGIMAIMDKPSKEFVTERRQNRVSLPLTVIFDRIRDPGNTGGVIRALAAVGCEQIIMIKGCCDVWDPKVLRGAMGGHFAIPIYQDVTWDLVRSYLPHSFNVVLADSNSYEVSVEAENIKSNSKEFDESTGQTSRYEYDKERKQKVHVDVELRNPLFKARTMKMATYEHHEVDFPEADHVALIMGPETGGLSTAAYQFTHKYYGVRCHVPMSNGINSLNVMAATAIIAFEMKRQFQTIDIEALRKEPVESSNDKSLASKNK